MRSLLAGLLACLILSTIGCGGGGSPGGEGNPPAPTTNRKDLLFGYYGPASPEEVADHVNIVWLWEDQVATAMRAKAAGITHLVLPVCWRCGADNLRFMFTGMRNASVLGNVVALYPEDEPGNMPEAEIAAMVTLVRSVAAEYAEIAQVPVWAIFAANAPLTGSHLFDAIGVDNYGCSCVPVPPLVAGQRLILVPGGANPWREGVEPFIRAANLDSRVVAIIPFLWQYPIPAQGLGIRDNGLAPIYREAGIRLTR